MKITANFLLMLAATILLTSGAPAADSASVGQVSYLKLDQGDKPNGHGGVDAQLDQRKSEFFRFAQAKLDEMNRNHYMSRSRMHIEKNQDGSYQATFHQIDNTSMAFEISRSTSKSIPYVAVLSYKEQVLATSCPTPEACRNGKFTAVSVIPNRHIFSYSNGSWK